MKDFFHFFLLTKEILRSVVQFCRPAHQVLVGFLILGSFSAGNWVEELWPFCHLFPLFLLDFYSDCANPNFWQPLSKNAPRLTIGCKMANVALRATVPDSLIWYVPPSCTQYEETSTQEFPEWTFVDYSRKHVKKRFRAIIFLQEEEQNPVSNKREVWWMIS